METPVVMALALVPALALMLYMYFQDKSERVPFGMLILIFVAGVISAAPAIVLEMLAEKMIDVTFGGAEMIRLMITAFFGVAIIEEGVKFIAAYLISWRSRHFNYRFQGIVFTLAASMGFAGIENVLYLFQQQSIDSSQVLSMGIGRGLLAIPAHGMCAIFMGYFYGKAKFLKSYERRGQARKTLIKGYFIACSLHAFYDFCLFTGNPLFKIIFFIFVFIADCFTIVQIRKAKKENNEMYHAPAYKQLWVNADPYQLYGGYQAPTYGGYNYGGPGQPGQVQQQSQYQPQTGTQQPQAFQPQMQFQPQTGTQQPQAFQPQMQFQPQTEIQQTGSQMQFQPQQQYQPAQQIQYQPQGQQAQPVQPAQPKPMYIKPKDQQIHCPICGKNNYFSAFYCSDCGASLHNIPLNDYKIN